MYFRFLAIATTVIIIFSRCSKPEPVFVNYSSVVMGKTEVVSADDSSCVLKARYFINSPLYDEELMQSEYFRIVPGYSTLEFSNGDLLPYTIQELSKVKVTPEIKPFSLVFLMDKTIKSITEGFNNGHLKGFESSFRGWFAQQDGYEINFAEFGKGNNYFNSYKLLLPKFVKNVAAANTDVLFPLFDATINQGTPNLAEALDSAIDYMKTNADYENRFILVFTDHTSQLQDTALITNVTERAIAAGVHICIYSTLYPDFNAYGHLALCNRTGGYYFSVLSNKISYDSYPLALPGFYKFCAGHPYYESELIINSTSRFKTLKWALLLMKFEFFDYSTKTEQILYENR